MDPRRIGWLCIATGLLGCQTEVPNQGLPIYGGPEAPEDVGTEYEGAERSDGGAAEGACGDTHYVDMTLTGFVLDAAWQPAADLEVWVEERTWTPLNRHGDGVTDETGFYRLELTALPIVEGCWGVGPQFYVASADGVSTCEVPANMQLVLAWLDGTLEADISGYPCVLDEG